MIYGFFSDAHGVLADFQAALEALSGADRLYCLGDLAGGREATECIGLLRSRGIVCVRGNHDHWAFELTDLSAADREFLGDLPLTVEDGGFLALHSLFERRGHDVFFQNLDSSHECRQLLARYDHRLLFVGHSHTPRVNALVDGRLDYTNARRQPKVRLDASARYIVDVGSARECAVLYDDEAGTVTFRFHVEPSAAGEPSPYPTWPREGLLSRVMGFLRRRC